MQTYDYDLVVIGAGSGGLAAAKRAVQLGRRVAIAEKAELGGTCVNRGCIPTKLMIYAAEFAHQQRLASDYGWTDLQGRFDWGTFKQAMDEHVRSLRQIQADALEGADILRGEAQFVDAHTLKVADKTMTSEYVLLAVGSRPTLPDIPGIEHALTSRDMIQLDRLPETFLIVGGGYIGVEFAQVLRSFGCQVTLVDSQPHVLDAFDCDLQKRVRQVLERDDIRVIDNARLKEIEPASGELMATLADGQTVTAQQVLCALGRTPNADTLNLADVGIEVKDQKIVVDAYSRTSIPHIFAVGDCTDRLMLTPVAKAEAKAAVETMFSDRPVEISYRWVPSAVFMVPEVAAVGLTERDAREQFDPVDVICNTFSPLRNAITPAPVESLIKLVVDPQTQRILGLHMIAPGAAALVQALVPALKQGLTPAELADTVGIHPSVGEEIFAL